MVFTGLLMWFIYQLPAISRTSAIFVHDVFAWSTAAVLAGHIRKAFQDPQARRGMRTGHVDRDWADQQHPRWLATQRTQSHGSTAFRSISAGSEIFHGRSGGRRLTRIGMMPNSLPRTSIKV